MRGLTPRHNTWPVAIYLDANVLFSWPTLTELERVALSSVASQLQQDVVIPSLVVEEAEAHRRHALDAVVANYERAVGAVEKAFPTEYVHVEPYPDVDEAMDRWHRVLNQFAVVVETEGGHALEGLRREIAGAPPAKSREPSQADEQRKAKRKAGAGGRDAAIWMTVADDVRRRAEPAHLITNDGQFGDGDALRAGLVAEVAPAQVTLHASVSAFVSQFGREAVATLSLEELEQRAGDAVKVAVEGSAEVGLAIWDGAAMPDRQKVRVVSASAVSIAEIKSYEATGDDAPFFIADTVWELQLDLLYKNDRDQLEENNWYVLEGCDVRTAVQLFLQSDRAEVVGVQVEDAPSAFMHDDGTTIIMGRSHRSAL